MLRRSFSGLIGALLFAVLVSTSAFADVTGSIENHLIFFPSGTQTEAVTFDVDLVTALSVNLTVSGVTAGLDIRFGTSGIENAVLRGATNLGALSAETAIVFGQPYACVSFPIEGQCLGPFVVPAADIGGGVRGNGLGLVQLRQELGLSIAGVQFGILTIFEDVDFPDIYADNNNHRHHHLLDGEAYAVGDFDGWPNNFVPTFGFGGGASFCGQTVSGIDACAEFDFCAVLSDYKHIKSAKFRGVVNENCSDLDQGYIKEGGPVDGLAFDAERYSVRNIPLGGFFFDIMLENRPLQPLNGHGTIRGNVFDLAHFTIDAISVDVTSGNFDEIQLTLSSANALLTVLDKNGDFDYDEIDLHLSYIINAYSNPIEGSLLIETDNQGLNAVSLDAGLTRGTFQVGLLSQWIALTGNSLEWSSVGFNISFNVLEFMTAGANLTYASGGMQNLTLSTGLTF